MAFKKKAIIIPAVLLLLAGGGIFTISSLSKDSGTAGIAKYTIIPAGENDLSSVISNTGTIKGNGTLEVTTKLSATVSEVKVSLGDYVNKGDLLCVFDSSDLQAEYDSLKEQMDTTESREQNTHSKNQRDLSSMYTKKSTALSKAQETIDSAVKSRDEAYEKYNKLVEELDKATEEGREDYDYEGVSEQIAELYSSLSTLDEAVDSANTAYSDTETSYNEQIQTIQDTIDEEAYTSNSESQRSLDKLAEQIEECKVYAAQSGIITELNVTAGSLPASSTLMTIANTDETVVELTVKETDITKLSEGMRAVVTSKVLPDEKFPAKITRIVNVMSPAGLEEGATSGYKVEVTLDEPNEKLLIGMSATVDIVIDDIGEKLSVPYSGVFEENGSSYVFVAEKDSDGKYTVEQKQVTTGAESEFYVEVVSGDIQSGDLIVEDPRSGVMPDVKDGSRIEVNEK